MTTQVAGYTYGTNDVARSPLTLQVDSLGNSPINHALTAIAQEVAGMLQHTYLILMQGNNHNKTIAIRAIEPEYRQLLSIEMLTEGELEVLQLIVDGHNNSTIAQKLYITVGTVKTHVRNVLKKLYVSDHTQAAIRALRSGLVH